MRVRFALAIAFSTACSCWARSRHERPASIISTMLRRWPSARRSRFTISGCVVWSVSYAICISYPGGGDMSSVTLVGLEDSPRHQCIYTSADASRLCRNDRSPAIFTRRLARVQRVFCLYTAYLLVELQFLRYSRLDSANM